MIATLGRPVLDLFERTIYSPLNYRLGLWADVAAALAFLAAGLHFFSGPLLAAGAAFTVGLLAWGLLEYSLHRWLLHATRTRASRGHARHHADAKELISTPLLAIAATGSGLWALMSTVMPAGIAAVFLAGLYSGYNGFALLHHMHHHGAMGIERLACFRRLARRHAIHHERTTVNFGTTTTMWDRLLGTYQAAD